MQVPVCGASPSECIWVSALKPASRKNWLKAIYDNPKWRHLYRFFWCSLCPDSIIQGITATSAEGGQQGAPEIPFGFSAAIHADVVHASERMMQVGGNVFF